MSTDHDRPDVPGAPRAFTPRPCPLCSKPSTAAFRPFCSRGCRDRDLNQWFDQKYSVPVVPAADEGDDYDSGYDIGDGSDRGGDSAN